MYCHKIMISPVTSNSYKADITRIWMKHRNVDTKLNNEGENFESILNVRYNVFNQYYST
jgi:hypothetical protein